MENGTLQTAAQQLRQKKAQVEATVAKLQMEANFNASGFYTDLLQRVDILVASGESISNPQAYFQQEITNAMNLYQISLENEMSQAFNLQGIFPFAVVNLSNTPPPASSSIVIENSLQVIGQKLLQKKAQVEASLLRLQMEIRINLIGYYEYLLQRVDILIVAGGSISDPIVYLQEEIGKASTRYQKPLAIALTEAFNLKAVLSGENREQQASSQAGTSSAASAATQTENEANSGTVALVEEDDIKSEFNSDVEDQMPEAAEESRNETGGYSQAAAEQWYNLYKQSMPPAQGPVNPNRRPSVPMKEEIMDDNPLAPVLYQPPAGHRVDSGSIEELEDNYLGDDDESENEDAIVEEEEEEFAREDSDHLEERDVIMSDEEEEDASIDDDEGNDSNEDAIMDESNDDEDDAAENMSEIEDDHQNDNGEENSSDDDESDDSSDDNIDDANYEEDGEEEEAQAALGVAGPSSVTLRRSKRHSARVTKASSVQEQQDSRQVSKRQTIDGRSSNGPRIGHDVVTEPVRIITLKLKCTVPGCKKAVKSKGDMNRHLLSAHKLKEYRCLLRRCHGKVSTSFTTQGQLNDHRDQFHDRTTRWTCKCSKKFKSYQVLCSHYRQYHELGQFACSKEDCTFKPTVARIKVTHHLRHHWEAKYECPFDGCDRSFKRKDKLDRHTLTHTAECPFACTECDKSFNRKDNLTRHLRMHQNDGPV